MKKLLSWILVLALCLCLFPGAALAEDAGEIAPVSEPDEAGTIASVEDAAAMITAPAADEVQASSGTCGDNLTWTLDGDGLLIISGEGEMTNWAWNLVAPWFEQRPSIREIRIESGVTSVGSYAFYGCSNLEKLTLAEGITDIGEFGFYECGALPELRLPESLCSIGPYAFSACDSLSSVTIPRNVTNIVTGAFTGDDSLTEILVEEGNPAYASRNGVLFNASGTALVMYPCGKSGAYAIPDGVERIEERAFAICSGLTGVTIPESVTSIGKTAFDSCNGLREVRIPAGVTEIGQSAFASCASMTKILVAEGNPAYASVDGVLYQADMTVLLQCPAGKTGEMAVPSSVKTIGEFAFDYCKQLTSVIIPDGVTDIGNYAFSGCMGLKRATFGAGITHIGALAFSGCRSLSEIRFKGSAPEIGTYAFDSVTADVYYPADDSSWTDEVRQSYRGTLTWLPWDPSPVSGDVNGDGTVDNADLIRMRKALVGTPATEIEETNSDVNGDGTVDLLDLVRMLKYFAGMDVTLE